jgi:hypothetical protein
MNGEMSLVNLSSLRRSILQENTLSPFIAAVPGCRYYTLTDLSSGRELDLLKDFGAAEPPPTTREGNPYVTDLVTRPNSKLLVAQFRVDSPRGEECRERAFILEGEKITPVTNTRRSCTNY